MAVALLQRQKLVEMGQNTQPQSKMEPLSGFDPATPFLRLVRQPTADLIRVFTQAEIENSEFERAVIVHLNHQIY